MLRDLFGRSREPDPIIAELHGSLEGIRDVLRTLSDRQQEGPTELAGLESRVSALEVMMAKALAEAEALVIKAESLKAAARAAEERTRYASKTALAPSGADNGDLEELTDEQIAEAYATAGVHPGDAPAGAPSAVQSLSSRLEGRRSLVRELAQRKFR